MSGSRRLMLLFCLSILLPGLVLTGFGVRAVGNERELIEKEWQQRLDRAAEDSAQRISDELGSWMSALSTFSVQTPPDLKQLPDTLRDVLGRPGMAAIRVERNQQVEAWPAGVLSFARSVDLPQDPPAASFVAAEALELRGDYAAAVAAYAALLRTAEAPDDRAWLLHRQARALRKAGKTAEASRTLELLGGLRNARVGYLPAGFAANLERLELTPSDKAKASADLLRDLIEGRWRLESASYAYYLDQLTDASARAITALERERLADVRSKREVLTAVILRPGEAAGSDAYIFLQRPDSSGAAAPTLVVDRRWFLDRMRKIAVVDRRATGVATTLEAVQGPRSPARLQSHRTVTVGAITLTVRVEPSDPAAVVLEESRRRRIYLALLGGIAVLLIAGTYLTHRVARREMAIAQLKSDFVAAVSHELRSPLTGIRQLGEMLARGRVPNESRRQDYYERITAEADRLTRVVENLLDFDRLEAGRRPFRFQHVPARDWLAHVVDGFINGAPRTHRVIAALDEALPTLRLDPDAMSTAITNVLDNAVKFSPGADAVWLEAIAEGDDVVIRVRDEGIGIAGPDKAHVFDRFYRGAQHGARQIGGTGLGLSLVHRIVTAHGGRISLESRVGLGTTVSIHLRVDA